MIFISYRYVMRSLLPVLLISFSLSTSQAEIKLSALVEDDAIASDTIEQQSLSPIIVVESPYNYETTLQNLKKAIAGRNFRLIRIQELSDGFDREMSGSRNTMVYFCNFNLVDKAIKIDQRIGQFLPCRITVHESNGKVLMMAINPEPISSLLGHQELKHICHQVSSMYRDLLEDTVI